MESTSLITKAVWGKSIDYLSPDEFRTLVAQPIFSNQKSRDHLNFQPQIPLSTGLAKIIKIFSKLWSGYSFLEELHGEYDEKNSQDIESQGGRFTRPQRRTL